MNARRVFMVGDNVDAKTAVQLAQHFYDNHQIQAVDYSRQDAFNELEPADVSKLVFLGHSNGQEYGNDTPKRFAERLDDAFKKNKKLKPYVEHLYLVGCDMGVGSEDELPLAQQIVDELHKKGFENAIVHSVAKPEGSVGQALYVEVVTQVSRYDFTGQTKEGYLNAFLFSEHDAKEYDAELKSSARNARAKAEDVKQKKAFIFLEGANPVVELDKPHNTFIANETLEHRKGRLSNHPYTMLSHEQQRALACLEKRCDYERRKGKKDYAQNIEFIIRQLRRAEPTDWQRLLKSYKSYLTVTVFGVHLNRKSNTLKLIDLLCDGKLDEAESAVKGLDEVTFPTQERKETKKHYKLFKSRKKESEVERQPLLGRKEASSSPPREIQPAPRGQLKEVLFVDSVKREIRGLIDTLNDEIAQLEQSCFPFFNQFEIHTKTVKRDALIVLSNQRNLVDMQQQANFLIQNNSRVMRSMKTTRVRDLVTKIAEFKAESGRVIKSEV